MTSINGNAVPVKAVYNPAVTEDYDIPRPTTLKCSALFEFGITVINELSFNQSSTESISKTILHNYRATNEKANVLVNPLLIVRILLLLAHCADDDSKTEQEIVRVFKTAIGQPKNEDIEKCHQELENILAYFPHLVSSQSAMCIFIEQRDSTPIRTQFQRGLKQLFRNHYVSDSNLVQEMNFAIDPTGEAVARRINEHMFEESEYTVKSVVRRDLAPDWRCRMMAAGATDDRFFIRCTSASIVNRYFYNDFKQNSGTRTFTETLVGVAPLRMKECEDYCVVEFIGKNNRHSLVIVMPKTEPLSDIFLKRFTSEKFSALYLELHSADPCTTENHFSIPTMNIESPMSLQSIFHRKKSWWPFCHDPLAMNRAFCPYKAEFAKIIGKKSDTPSRIFALHDIHVGCKFMVDLNKRKPVVLPEKRKHVIKPPKPVVIKNTSAKVVTIRQPDGGISNVIIDLNVQNILSDKSKSEEFQPAPTAPKVLSHEPLRLTKKTTNFEFSTHPPVSITEVVPSSVRVSAGIDQSMASTENQSSINCPPPLHPLSIANGSGADAQNNLQNPEDSANITVASSHQQLSVPEMSRARTGDNDQEEIAGSVRHKPVVDDEIDKQLISSTHGAVIDKPFFFVILHRDNNKSDTFMPRVIGRFTNVKEVQKPCALTDV